VGLFGGSSSSKSNAGSQNQGFSDVESGEQGILNVGLSGGKKNVVRVTTTDRGAVRGALDLAKSAVEGAQRSSDSSLDVVEGLKAKDLGSEGQKLGQIMLFGMLGLGAIQLLAARSRSK